MLVCGTSKALYFLEKEIAVVANTRVRQKNIRDLKGSMKQHNFKVGSSISNFLDLCASDDYVPKQVGGQPAQKMA